jgi:predicted permease
LTPKLPDATARNWHWLSVAGRLKPGVTREQAAAELKVLAQRLAVAHPASDKGNGFLFEQAGSLPPRDRTSVMLFLTALSVVVLLVLCIACANVANLLLAQSAGRQRETGIRVALGATRGRLLRQMLIESVLLALGGGLVGVVLSLWATSALSSFRLPAPIPLDLSIGLDWRVLLYAFALSVGTGLLFGFVPAWVASHPNVMSALKGEDALARPERRWSLRNILVVAQIAISVVLLCATGLFLRSLQSAAGIDTGFRSSGVLMMAVDPSVHGYTPERTTQLLSQLRERIATLPSVTSVAYADLVPLSGGGRSDGMVADGRPAPPTGPIGTELYMVSPGYFETMGIPRIAGPDFSNERPDAPKVAIVNEEFAHRLFGHDNPIGQTVNGGGVTYQIIGVVKNIKSRTLGEETRPVLYRSLAQNIAGDPSFNGNSLMIRSDGDPANLANAVRREISSLDPTLAVYNIETMKEHLHDALFLPRLAGTLFGVFGFIGLLLASIGLYGVISYSVSRRTQEIGIRMALGADRARVVRHVLSDGLRPVAIGMVIGISAAFALGRLLSSVLFHVTPRDPQIFALAVVTLVIVAIAACFIPARRASRVDPINALRSE